MKRFLKWAGIVLGALVILALVVVLPLALRGVFAGRMGFYGRMPMMDGHFLRGGFFGGGLVAFLGLLGLVAVVFLVVAGGMALFRAGARSSGTAPAPSSSTPVGQPPLQAAQPLQPAAPAALACTSCGRALQPDWVNCPYCGSKIEPPQSAA